MCLGNVEQGIPRNTFPRTNQICFANLLANQNAYLVTGDHHNLLKVEQFSSRVVKLKTIASYGIGRIKQYEFRRQKQRQYGKLKLLSSSGFIVLGVFKGEFSTETVLRRNDLHKCFALSLSKLIFSSRQFLQGFLKGIDKQTI